MALSGRWVAYNIHRSQNSRMGIQQVTQDEMAKFQEGEDAVVEFLDIGKSGGGTLRGCVPPLTTDVPTEDGWYWAYRAGFDGPAMVELDDHRVHMANGMDVSVNLFTHWSGPMDVPAVPE